MLTEHSEVISLQQDDRFVDYIDPILNINTNILKPETNRYKNKLIEDIKYEKAGSNGIFESNPSIVKIRGFELNKKQRIKILLTNKSKFSQRVSLIPPTTPFFKVKYSRRGIIAPGLSENIILSFTPQSYQYYYDFIRVICEGEKMIIPIHAYPKMNIHMREYVPKYLDFGTVQINSGEHKEIVLKNIIDVGFEFELIPIKTCNEIKVEPLLGEIEPISNKILSFIFNPVSYGTFRAEYEFRLSEFDFQPVIISVFGSCNVFDKVLNENIIKHMKKLKEKNHEINASNFSLKDQHKIKDSILSTVNDESRNRLNSVSIVSKDNPLIKQKTLTTNTNANMNVNITTASPKGLSKRFKAFPSNIEREFLNYYNNIETIIKDKDIKYIRFVGKPLLNHDEINKIVSERIKDLENNLMIRRKIDLNRHQPELDTEKCTVDRSNRYLLKPTFDFNQNDKFFKTRHYINIFLKNMTKIVINKRADDRLSKLKGMIQKNNIKTSQDFSDLVERDWLNFNANSEEKSEKKETKIKFIAPISLNRQEVWLANDFNIDLLKQEISHENNINLDELKEFRNVQRNDYEVIGYKEFKSPGMTMYEISTHENVMRTCADYESVIRGERGDSELAYDKLLSNNIIDMPESYRHHVSTTIDTLLISNPAFKKYSNYSKYTESGTDYNLQPRIINTKANLLSSYGNDLYRKLPLSIYENIPQYELDNHILIGDNSLNFLPSKLTQADNRDLFVKKGDKIDEDNYVFDLAKDDEEKLIEMFEKDDEVIKSVREANRGGVSNTISKEKETLESLLRTQKRKWAATLPTLLEHYNACISNPSNKFIL